MKKLLSICIPTFNRQGYLDALLANIEKQLKQFDLYQKVEVIVSDNCSEDETASTATKYANFVDYSRNDKNIGPDANFLSLFSKAEGEYIWLPGDDDEIRGDTIAYIINCIEDLKFDFLYLKTEGEQIEHVQRGALKLSNVELLTRVNIFTTFMTSQVIRADLIKEQIEDARVYLGGFMAYYKIFLEALWRSEKCFISNGKEIFANADNTGSYLFYKVWSQSVFDVLLSSSFSKNKKLVALMKIRMFLALILPITYKLKTGTKGFYFLSENPEQSMEKYFNALLYRYIFRAYIRFPSWALFPLHKSLRVFTKIHAKIIGGVL